MQPRLASALPAQGFSHLGESRWALGPVSIDIRPNWDGIHLADIRVDEEERAMGHATQALERLKKIAQNFERPLLVAEEGLGAEARVWLERRGFRADTGTGPWALKLVVEKAAPKVQEERRKGMSPVMIALSVVMLLTSLISIGV